VALAQEKGVDMPICQAMDEILNHGVSVDAAITEVLDRPIKEELDFSAGR
jgi:glycerol-3-phosphate dehydrogenase (NAD(P)+)